MIKFTGKSPTGKILGLGLSEENIKRLKTGQPIHLWVAEFMPQMDEITEILILYGETEEAIAENLSDLMTQDTIIKDERKRKKH